MTTLENMKQTDVIKSLLIGGESFVQDIYNEHDRSMAELTGVLIKAAGSGQQLLSFDGDTSSMSYQVFARTVESMAAMKVALDMLPEGLAELFGESVLGSALESLHEYPEEVRLVMDSSTVAAFLLGVLYGQEHIKK